jgi:indole-3-glycerol phosphate synthase
LRDLQVRFERFGELRTHLPSHLPTVAESGIGSVAHIETVALAGYRLALVGSSLMRAAEPAPVLQEWLTAGRNAIARRPS